LKVAEIVGIPENTVKRACSTRASGGELLKCRGNANDLGHLFNDFSW